MQRHCTIFPVPTHATCNCCCKMSHLDASIVFSLSIDIKYQCSSPSSSYCRLTCVRDTYSGPRGPALRARKATLPAIAARHGHAAQAVPVWCADETRQHPKSRRSTEAASSAVSAVSPQGLDDGRSMHLDDKVAFLEWFGADESIALALQDMLAPEACLGSSRRPALHPPAGGRTGGPAPPSP